MSSYESRRHNKMPTQMRAVCIIIKCNHQLLKFFVIRKMKSKEDEMGQTCSLLGREKCTQSCGGKLTLKRPF